MRRYYEDDEIHVIEVRNPPQPTPRNWKTIHTIKTKDDFLNACKKLDGRVVFVYRQKNQAIYYCETRYCILQYFENGQDAVKVEQPISVRAPEVV